MDRRAFLRTTILAGTGLVVARLPAPAGAAGRYALVTADAESHVAIVSLGAGRVHRRLQTERDPRSIEAAPGGRAVVAHTAIGAVSLLEGAPLRVVKVLRGLGAPRYTAIAPGGRHAYVSDSAGGDIVVIDLGRRAVVRRVTAGAHARHVRLDPRGRTLWVALGTKAPALAVLTLDDPRRPRLERTFRTPFLAHDVGFSPTGRRVWVTSGGGGQLAVYGAGDRRPSLTLGADLPPQHVSFARGRAYVTSGDSATLRVHALDDGRLLRTATVPVGSYNVQRGGGWVLTPSLQRGTLTIADTRGAVRRTVSVAKAAHDACVLL